MFSYHTLKLLAEARQADLLREAQPQLRAVAPKGRWGSVLSSITRGGRRRPNDRPATVVATDSASSSAPTIPSSDPLS